jgi:DNA-binding MarR family transcriptional regulator
MPRLELLREVARLYTRQQRQAVALCDGTSLTQCSILTEVGRAGDLNLGELAQAIGFDKSWTSRAVDVLTDTGLLTKEADRDDGRRVRLTLTRKGRARFESLNAELDAHARRVLDRIPSADRAAVQRALALLHDALQDQAAKPDEVACAR